MSKVNVSFLNLGLNENILRAISDLGYIEPFFIQEKCIPFLLKGCDVLCLAQTGSGKTAAFILPLLHNIDPVLSFPQVLILAPTRELAIQLGDVCIKFSRYMQGINVVSLYGGQSYDVQFRALKKGPQVIVGTPGRLLDHLNRKILCLSKLRSLVIDEADEMLRMGFIDDVRSIVLKVPKNHQTALFSATFPKEIRSIASNFMNSPKKIYLSENMIVSSNIKQNYWLVSNFSKQDALMRFLEVENFDAALVFVRTKSSTLEISSILEKNGYNSAALNGDMNQILRQNTLERLKNGELDILIATDVASRGLDVDRITLVINYDAPMDFESYIHRIGRTGRAGRIGRSLLFIKNSEYRLLRYIERNKSFSISKVKMPSQEVLIRCRLDKFSDRVRKVLKESTDLDEYCVLLSKIKLKEGLDIENLAAILLKMAQGGKSLVLSSDIECLDERYFKNSDVKSRHNQFKLSNVKGRKTCVFVNGKYYFFRKRKNMDLYSINLGKDDGISVRHIIAAIVNDGDISTQYVGYVKLFSSHAIIELSNSIPNIFLHFNKIRILNKPISIRSLGIVSSYSKHLCRNGLKAKNSTKFLNFEKN